MMSEQEFIKSQKDCASMLGMSLNEYEEYCKNSKVNAIEKQSKRKYDNSILPFLGLTEQDLKVNKNRKTTVNT